VHVIHSNLKHNTKTPHTQKKTKRKKEMTENHDADREKVLVLPKTQSAEFEFTSQLTRTLTPNSLLIL